MYFSKLCISPWQALNASIEWVEAMSLCKVFTSQIVQLAWDRAGGHVNEPSASSLNEKVMFWDWKCCNLHFRWIFFSISMFVPSKDFVLHPAVSLLIIISNSSFPTFAKLNGRKSGRFDVLNLWQQSSKQNKLLDICSFVKHLGRTRWISCLDKPINQHNTDILVR